MLMDAWLLLLRLAGFARGSKTRSTVGMAARLGAMPTTSTEKNAQANQRTMSMS